VVDGAVRAVVGADQRAVALHDRTDRRLLRHDPHRRASYRARDGSTDGTAASSIRTPALSG
jgi:hypothetical protein